MARIILAQAYEQQTRFAEALAELNQARGTVDHPWILPLQSRVYAQSGQRSEASEVLDQLEEMSLCQHIPPYLTATAYAALGEREQAFGWLEKACADRDSWLVFLKVEPGVDSLRADPRFANLLHRVGPQSANNRVMEKSWTRTNGDS